jgi:hypothetical protein
MPYYGQINKRKPYYGQINNKLYCKDYNTMNIYETVPLICDTQQKASEKSYLTRKNYDEKFEENIYVTQTMEKYIKQV